MGSPMSESRLPSPAHPAAVEVPPPKEQMQALIAKIECAQDALRRAYDQCGTEVPPETVLHYMLDQMCRAVAYIRDARNILVNLPLSQFDFAPLDRFAREAKIFTDAAAKLARRETKGGAM